MLTGVAYAVQAYFVHPHNAPFISVATAMEIGKGTALFPLLILAGSVFASGLRNQLIQASPLTLSVAGVVSLFATLSS